MIPIYVLLIVCVFLSAPQMDHSDAVGTISTASLFTWLQMHSSLHRYCKNKAENILFISTGQAHLLLTEAGYEMALSVTITHHNIFVFKIKFYPTEY